MRSDSTLVPPVTAERSPPLSRMTGADSPVMADSSTEATPSITSPSPGISSPASTTTRSPVRRAVALTASIGAALDAAGAPWSACASCRSDSAWALPRPSATASAKLANSTVNHSHSDTLTREPQRRHVRAAGEQVAQEQHRGQQAAHLDHEHDRVARHLARATACAAVPRAGRTRLEDVRRRRRATRSGGCSRVSGRAAAVVIRCSRPFR